MTREARCITGNDIIIRDGQFDMNLSASCGDCKHGPYEYWKCEKGQSTHAKCNVCGNVIELSDRFLEIYRYMPNTKINCDIDECAGVFELIKLEVY